MADTPSLPSDKAGVVEITCGKCGRGPLRAYMFCEQEEGAICHDCWPAIQCEERHGEFCAVANWEDGPAALSPSPVVEEAGMLIDILRERTGQDFDGECHLTAAEVDRLVTFLRAPTPTAGEEEVERATRAVEAARGIMMRAGAVTNGAAVVELQEAVAALAALPSRRLTAPVDEAAVEQVMNLIEERLCIFWYPRENRDQFAGELAAALQSPSLPTPMPMLLFCPKCGLKHIDEVEPGWDNPPHTSHLCRPTVGGCGTIWRAADVPTAGVERIETSGRTDTIDLNVIATLPTDGLRAALEGLVEGVRRHCNEPGGGGISGFLGARLVDAENALIASPVSTAPAADQGGLLERLRRRVGRYRAEQQTEVALRRPEFRDEAIRRQDRTAATTIRYMDLEALLAMAAAPAFTEDQLLAFARHLYEQDSAGRQRIRWDESSNLRALYVMAARPHVEFLAGLGVLRLVDQAEQRSPVA